MDSLTIALTVTVLGGTKALAQLVELIAQRQVAEVHLADKVVGQATIAVVHRQEGAADVAHAQLLLLPTRAGPRWRAVCVRLGLQRLAQRLGLLHQGHRLVNVTFLAKSLGLLLELLNLGADLLCVL